MKIRRFRRAFIAAAALAAVLPAVSGAIQLSGGVTIEKGSPGSYVPFDPCTETILVGEDLHIVMTLQNNTGALENLCPGDGEPGNCGNCMTFRTAACYGDLNDFAGSYYLYPNIPGDYKMNANNADSPVDFIGANPVPFSFTGGETQAADWTWRVIKKADANFNVFAFQNWDFDCWYGGPSNEGTDPGSAACIITGAPGEMTDLLPCPIQFRSPLQANTVWSLGSPGTRPADVVYIEDNVAVRATVQNIGAGVVSIGAGQACATYTKYLPGVETYICLYDSGNTGGCIAGIEPDSPPLAPAVTIPAGNTELFDWSYTIAGNSCVLGSSGFGTVWFDTNVGGETSQSSKVFVERGPIQLSVSWWVDPDRGGVEGILPLGVTPSDPTLAAYLYYMADEWAVARVYVTNTSPYRFPADPAIATIGDNNGNPSYKLVPPGPAMPVMLEPAGVSGSIAVFDFYLEPEPAFLGNCTADDLFQLYLTVQERGVEIQSGVTFLKTPFQPTGACGGPFTFNVNKALKLGFEFPVTVNMRNMDSRKVRIAPPAGVTVMWDSNPPGNPDLIRQTGGPNPSYLPLVWNPGELKTMTWTYTTNGIVGGVCWEAKLFWPESMAWPCGDARHTTTPCPTIACSDIDVGSDVEITSLQIIGCADPPACTVRPPVPSRVSSEPGATVFVEICIMNNSLTASSTITEFCHGAIVAYPGNLGDRYFQPKVPLIIPPATTTCTIFQVQTMDCLAGMKIGCYLSDGSLDKMVEGDNGITELEFDATNTIDATVPALMDCTIRADKFPPEYSGGQTIRLFLSTTNWGQNDLTGYSVNVTANPTVPGAVSFISSSPAPPGVLTGYDTCGTSNPKGDEEYYEYDYAAANLSQKATVTFCANFSGYDEVSGYYKLCQRCMDVYIKKPSVLSVTAWATPLATMGRTCPTCPLYSDCMIKGENCITVWMRARNMGEIGLVNLFPSMYPAVGACPPECSALGMGGAAWGGVSPNASIAQTLGENKFVDYYWTYTPTALGCVRFQVEATGNDAATGNPHHESVYTNCVEIMERPPVEVQLVRAPSQVMRGQEFEVEIEINNPGATAVTLQGGEPAIIFIEVGRGSAVTERFEVRIPTPLTIGAWKRTTVKARVRVLPSAPMGASVMRIPQSSMYQAYDAQTGYQVKVVNTGSDLTIQVMEAGYAIDCVDPNPFRPLKDEQIKVCYRVAEEGKVLLRVYTISGELVKTIVNGRQGPGLYTVNWDGRNRDNRVCASGVYLLRFEGATYSSVKKLAILK